MFTGRKRISNRAFILHPDPFTDYEDRLNKLKSSGTVVYNLSKPRVIPVYFTEIPDSVNEGDLIEKYRRIFKVSEDLVVIPFPDTFSAISSLFFLFMDLNDEVVLPEPFPPYILPIVDFAGVKITPIETFHSNGFRLPLRDVLEPLINPRVKLLFYSNPAISTGTLFTPEEIERLLFVSQNYNILMVSDESFAFASGKEIQTLLDIAKRYTNSISLNRILLPFTGVPTCFLTCGSELGKLLKKFQETIFPVSSGLVRLTYTALDRFSELLPSMSGFLGERRDILYEVVSGFEDFFIIKPDSPPAGVIKLPINDSAKFVEYLLKEFRMDNRTVFVLPLSKLFHDSKKGKDLVMVDYSNLDVETLKTGLNILYAGVNQYKKEEE